MSDLFKTKPSSQKIEQTDVNSKPSRGRLTRSLNKVPKCTAAPSTLLLNSHSSSLSFTATMFALLTSKFNLELAWYS